ncbi:MAG TPA: cbb3-type cytochrome oxidase assembly protein CcoS [Crocinitomix sp.]|nr:cbb3-type cytochrome oxidase assembly protein CcoS [Crocinitomix sp.]
MQIVFALIFISVGLALFFLLSFLWANKNGQFEDTYGPAHRMLFDNDDELNNQKTEKKWK